MSFHTVNMNRRQFLAASAGFAGAALFPACAHNQNRLYVSEMEKLSVLDAYNPRASSSWIARGDQDNSYALFKKTIEAATDFSWLTSGDSVMLKFALNKGNPYPATTDPWAISCMTKLLKEKGAGRIYVADQSGVQSVLWTESGKMGSSRQCCASAGLLGVIEETGATPLFFEEQGYDAYVPVLPEGIHHWNTPIWITSSVNQVEHIIYLGRVSSHVLGDATIGFKLSVGFLREDSRKAFHQGGENLYAMYEEINQVSQIKNKFRLAVSSGRSVFSTFGPDDGHVSSPEYGLLIASEDLLAHELLCYAWLQWNREYETPFYADATTGHITRWRSTINRGFVWVTWDPENKTPSIPLFRAENIYSHPSVINYMKRMGGRPGKFQWEQVNACPNKDITKFIEKIVTPMNQENDHAKKSGGQQSSNLISSHHIPCHDCQTNPG
jgi:uncharacterized protein (DUF362 family)